MQSQRSSLTDPTVFVSARLFRIFIFYWLIICAYYNRFVVFSIILNQLWTTKFNFTAKFYFRSTAGCVFQEMLWFSVLIYAFIFYFLKNSIWVIQNWIVRLRNTHLFYNVGGGGEVILWQTRTFNVRSASSWMKHGHLKSHSHINT